MGGSLSDQIHFADLVLTATRRMAPFKLHEVSISLNPLLMIGEVQCQSSASWMGRAK